MLKRLSVSQPRAETHPETSTWHGISVRDDYAWLKAANWQDVMRDPSVLDPAIRAYLDAENAYADQMLADTAALQDKLFAEMKARIKEDDSTVPAKDGPFAYYHRYREGGQHPLFCREPRGGGKEELLLDGDARAEGKAYFHLGSVAHSPDHRLFAWSADDAGSEFYTIFLRDTTTREDLSDVVRDTTGSAVWARDGSAFYYVRLDANHRPCQVFRHRIGTPVESDVLIYEEPDCGFFVSVSDTQAGQIAEIASHDHETSQAWTIDLADAQAMPVLVAEREPLVQYDVDHHPSLFGTDALIFRTNADGAEDFKVSWTPRATPGRAHWRDLIPHRPGIYILDVTVCRDWLVRLEREEGLPRIVVRNLHSGDEHTISFDEEAYSLGVDAGYEFDTHQLRFTYSSMTTPSEVWDYDLGARTRVLRKRQEVPSGHDPAAYVSRRLFATAPDGESVPLSVLYRKDTALNGTAPCLLYGYGAYGMSMPAAFSTSRLSLVDRGFVYAIAHVRGGTEKGWRWYREGKLANKPNTFSDFVSAAEQLIASGLVAKNKIVAHGGSAGGMLIGAVANSRPDLFGGLIAEVPFVDVLNTMLDETLPLTPPEWPEWGNPLSDPESFRTILSYSPYENIRPQEYPPLLALAGLTDPRVTYWEPAKWIARLRATRLDDNLVALRINMDAGHGGASGRFDRLKEVALAYAFAIKVTGGTLV